MSKDGDEGLKGEKLKMELGRGRAVRKVCLCDSHTHPACLLLRPDRENLETSCILVDVIVPALPPLTNFGYEGGE